MTLFCLDLLTFRINFNLFSNVSFLIAIFAFWNGEVEIHFLEVHSSFFTLCNFQCLDPLISDCRIERITSLLVKYLLLYLWKPENFDFVKVVWCFPDFWFLTFRLLDIDNIAFDLWFIYFLDFRVSETESFTLDKIEGFFPNFR